MEDCSTPTFTNPKEFKFNLTPTTINAAVSPYPDVRNIMASRRSFTPVHANFRSPGLSPICKLPGALGSPVTAHHSSSFMEFKKPTRWAKPVATFTHSPKVAETTMFLSPNPTFGNSFLTPPSFGASDGSNKSPQLEENKTTSFLDHALSLKLLLRTLDLERYCENFEKAGIDYQNLTDMKSHDLKSIGIKSDEDRKRIMEMFKNVFST